jgi:hypothetical protein
MSFWSKLFGKVHPKRGVHAPGVAAEGKQRSAIPAPTRTPASGGVGVNARNEYGQTALTLAAFDGDETRVEALIAAGADLAAKDDEGNSALGYAQGHIDIVSALESPPSPAQILPAGQLREATAENNLMRWKASGNPEECVPW